MSLQGSVAHVRVEERGSSLAVFVNEKFAGTVRGDTFFKTVKPSHILQKPRAVCMAAEVLGYLEEHGVSWIEILLSETGNCLRASLGDFRVHGFDLSRGGCEPQRGLVLSRWTDAKAGRQAVMAL